MQRCCWNTGVRRCCWAADVVSYLTLVFLFRNLSDPLLNTLAPSLPTRLEKCKVKQFEKCEAFILQSLGLNFICWAPSRSTGQGKEDAKRACLTPACVIAEGAPPRLAKQIMLPLALTFPRVWCDALSPRNTSSTGKMCWWASVPVATQQLPAVAGETGGADVAVASGFLLGQTSTDIFPSHVTY